MSTAKRSKAGTRDALVAAAAAEFAEHGLDASLDDVCARAGFTRGAFYVHFKDRDELLVAVIDRVLSRWQDALIGVRAGLQQTILKYVAVLASGESVTTGTPAWRFRHTLDACARVPAVKAKYLALQARAIERISEAAKRDARADIEPRQIAELLVLLTFGLSAAAELGLPIDVLAGGAALQRMLQTNTRSR